MSNSSNTSAPQGAVNVSLWLALLPVILLMMMLGASVYYFSDDSSYGANQIALLISAAVAAAIGVRLGHKWADIEQGIISGIANAMIAVVLPQ